MGLKWFTVVLTILFILIVSLDFSWKYEKSNESMYNEMPIYDHNYDNHDYTCRDPAAG